MSGAANSKPLTDAEKAYQARQKANRDAFPVIASVVDVFRTHFGAGVSAAGGVEAGKAFGAKPTTFDDACDGCDGSGCRHPNKATVFCGHRLVLSPIKIEATKGGKRGKGI